MKSIFYIVLLSAAFQCAVLQEECPTPTPTECEGVVGTCDNITCPLLGEVKCCVELVNGKCTPKILQLPSLTDVTNRCIQGRGVCSTKKCPEGMACIEDMLECPNGEQSCGIREVQGTCILLEIVRPPSSCNDIVCLENSTCVVSQTALGTKAECKRVKPKSCKDITCDDGMSCVDRNKPRCIPRRPSQTPVDCSQLQCPEDLTCLILDKSQGPNCAKLPPASSCEKLNCTGRLTCKLMEDTSIAKCVQQQPLINLIDRDCSKLDCDEGSECKLVLNRNLLRVATCMPTDCPTVRQIRTPTTCEELQCKSDEVCVLCGEGKEARAWCKANDISEQIEGNEIMESMLSSTTDTSTSLTDTEQAPRRNNSRIPRPPMSCGELICQSKREKCQVLTRENITLPIALCVSEDTPEKCEEAKCKEEIETCEEWENNEVMVARCVPAESAKKLNTLTPRSSIRRSLARRCEELKCGKQAECMQMIKNGTRRALCVQLRNDALCSIPSAKPVQKLNMLKIVVEDVVEDVELDEEIKKESPSLNLPDTCMERRCCEGKTCVVEKGLATCIPGEKVKQELAELVYELPSIYKQVLSDLPSLLDPIRYYKAFIKQTTKRKVDEDTFLPMLMYVIIHGNVTVYEWKHNEPPLNQTQSGTEAELRTEKVAEELEIDWGDTDSSTNNQPSSPSAAGIDFGTSGIDFGESEINFDTDVDISAITVEDSGDMGEAGTPAETKVEASDTDLQSLLDNTHTRNLFLDDVMELKEFLGQRIIELSQETSSLLVFGQFGGSEELSMQSVESLTEMLGHVTTIVTHLTNQRTEHLFLIKGSQRYLERLSESLQQELRLAHRASSQAAEQATRREEAAQMAVSIEPKLTSLIECVKKLQKQVVADISKRYNDRVVNLIGEINQI